MEAAEALGSGEKRSWNEKSDDDWEEDWACRDHRDARTMF